MSLTRKTIGAALEKSGITGEQAKQAEKELMRAMGIEDTRPQIEPWRFPAYTLKQPEKIAITPTSNV